MLGSPELSSCVLKWRHYKLYYKWCINEAFHNIFTGLLSLNMKFSTAKTALVCLKWWWRLGQVWAMGNSSPLQYKRATCLVSRDRLYWKVWYKFRLRSKVTAKELNSLVQCLLIWPFFPLHLLMTIKTERGKFSLSEPGASNGQFICINTWCLFTNRAYLHVLFP